jgi:predicted exporter
VGLIALAVFSALRFEVTTDITSFLDAPGSSAQGSLSRRLTQSDVTRTMVLSVSATDIELALRAASDLAARMREDPAVSWVSAGPDPELGAILEGLYFEHRYQLMSEDPERELPGRLDGDGLASASRALKRAIGGPLAPLIKSLAPADPLMAFPTLLRRLQGAGNPALALHEGQFLSRDGTSAIVFVGAAHPALDSAHNAPLLTRLEAEFTSLDEAAGGALRLELSALQRFSVRAAEAMRGDVTRLSLLSTVGIIVLFLAVFRSPRLIVVTSLPLLAGLLTGLALCLLLYGRINALTLAFGGALVGVCIDYPIHLLAHWWLEEDAPDASRALARVWPGVRLGAATSFVGFAALAGAGFPGIREIGVFAGGGIAGAVLVTAGALPYLVPGRRAGSPQAPARIAARLSLAIAWLAEHRARAAVLPIAALLVCAAGLPGMRWTDDVKALSPVDPALVAEETRVRERVLGAETSRVVIALGSDEEQALQRNDRVAMALEKLVAAGELDSFRSLHSFLWSADLQRRNRAQLAASPDLADRLLAELAEQGFRREAFSAFSDSLTGEPEPLRLGDLLGSPIAPWISPFVLPADEGSDDTASRVALVTLVRGVDDPAALLDTLAPIDGVVYLDQLALLEAGYGELRRAALRFVGLGAGLVLVLLWLHYRSLAATAIALLPALLACGTTAGLISLAGLPLNLVNLFGLLLILGMGVDYGVFLAESARQREPVGATAVGLLLSCTTSVLGLGLLSLSSNPGLRSLGVTTAVGVISSLLLGPAVLAVLGRRELEPTT